MFSVFFCTGEARPVRDYDDARRQDLPAFRAFFHAMLDRGVYLPPGASRRGSSPPRTTTRRSSGSLDALPAAARAAAAAASARRRGSRPVSERTVVHLLRHGEVHNPEKILYGRLPGYRLSDLGRAMAERAAEWFAGRDVVAWSSRRRWSAPSRPPRRSPAGSGSPSRSTSG